MKTEHVTIDSVMKLLVAARYAVENSGDHGCEWCKSWPNCPQCEAYLRLKSALKLFDGIEIPLPDWPTTLDFYNGTGCNAHAH